MKIRATATAFALLLTPAMAGAQIVYGIGTFARAFYQGNDGGTQTDEVLFPAPSLPVVAESRSYVPVGGATSMGRADRVTAYDDADAWARIMHPGVEQTYARVGGWTPQGGPPDGLLAQASADSTTKWMAVGPVGQMVSIDLNYFLDGWLYVGRAGGPQPLISAEVLVTMRIDRGNDLEVLFVAGGRLNHSTGHSTSFLTKNGWSAGAWEGAWTDTSDTLTSVAGTDFMWDLNYSEVIPHMFEVQSNTPFALYYSVDVSATNFLGPNEAFATADFSNTAGMGFSTTTPGFTVEEVGLVPEPSAMIALGAGVAALASRRRRR